MAFNHNGWLRGFLFIIPFVFVMGVFLIFGKLIVGSPILDPAVNETPFQKFVVYLFGLVGVFGLVLLFVKEIERKRFINVGFHIKNRIGDVVLGIFIGFLVVGGGFLGLWLTGVIEVVSFDIRFADLFYMLLFFVMVALAEELAMRGYILRNFMLSFNKYIALILSSVIFALIHIANSGIDWLPFLNLFLAGMILGIYYIFTRNLWFPVALHFSWNFFQALFGFNVSGGNFYSPMEINTVGNSLWHGGSFGFEGSLLAVIGQVVVIMLLFYFFRKKERRSVNQPEGFVLLRT